MNPNSSKDIAAFFQDKWPIYQRLIRGNVLCHREMLATLDEFLSDRFSKNPFSFADLGCGDGSAVVETLQNKTVAHYTGVDASADLIATASKILSPLNCEKVLICQDMATAIGDLPVPVDVVYCSYALHHLLLDQKIKFIGDCYKKLSTPGYLIVVDGVAREHESREQWLSRLDLRILENVPSLTSEDRAIIMEHPRESDFPETIATFRGIAQQTFWREFEVLFERDDFLAFMVFAK
jgi:SAM-dependent methyltransferase